MTYDYDGKTALHFACRHSDINSVKTLLDYGANLYSSDFCGQTALHLACRYPDIGIIKTLLDYGADFTVVDFNGHAPWAVDAISSIPKSDGRYHTILELILETDQDLRDKYDNTVLHLVVNNGCPHCVELCLKHGIDPQAINEDGLTALQVYQRYHGVGDDEDDRDSLAFGEEDAKIHQLLVSIN